MTSTILANHARKFNGSTMPHVNEIWASEVLSIPRGKNPTNGPDLEDCQKIVEVKFTLQITKKYIHKSWRVLDDQLKYGEGKDRYWALGFYQLDREVKEITESNPEELEKMVLERTLYIVKWDWMYNFPPYRQTGRTARGKYDNTIRFPKAAMLPDTIHKIGVKKGLINFTEGVDPDRFSILRKI